MTDTSTRTPSELLAADMLRINLEASIRCGKAREPRHAGYHASASAASWTAYRLLDRLRQLDPAGVEAFVAALIEELNAANYLHVAAGHAAVLGVDVDELADRVHAEY